MTRINLRAIDPEEARTRWFLRSRRFPEIPEIQEFGNFKIRKSEFDEYNSTIGFEHEEEIRKKYFYPYLKPRMTFVDVGAGWGVYTMYALAAGAQVYAFEPDPRIFYDLNMNVNLSNFGARFNGFTNALWDSQTRISFDELEDVLTITLDMTGIQPDYIKIDVEGAENRVIVGATETLIKYRPKILVENHPKKGGDARSTIMALGFYQYEEGPVVGDVSYSFFQE